MKADSSFNLSKSVKRILGTFTDKAARNAYKAAMISAELDYAANKKKMLSSRKDKDTKETV